MQFSEALELIDKNFANVYALGEITATSLYGSSIPFGYYYGWQTLIYNTTKDGIETLFFVDEDLRICVEVAECDFIVVGEKRGYLLRELKALIL